MLKIKLFVPLKVIFNTSNHIFKRSCVTCPQLKQNVKPKPIFHNFLRHNQTNSLKCWKCGVERQNAKQLFCEQCNIIQSPYETQNCFRLFDLSTDFVCSLLRRRSSRSGIEFFARRTPPPAGICSLYRYRSPEQFELFFHSSPH